MALRTHGAPRMFFPIDLTTKKHLKRETSPLVCM
jgi:hypothetical protein